jgi:hypothetical protein
MEEQMRRESICAAYRENVALAGIMLLSCPLSLEETYRCMLYM